MSIIYKMSNIYYFRLKCDNVILHPKLVNGHVTFDVIDYIQLYVID